MKIPVALLFVAALSACSGPRVQESPAEEYQAEGLHPVSGSGFERAYALPGAELGRYAGVRCTPMSADPAAIGGTAVSGSNRRDWELTAERRESLARVWLEACRAAFAAYPREAGSGGLQIDARLTGLRPGRTAVSATTASGVPVYGAGDAVEVNVEFRLLDEADGRLLALVQDRQNLPVSQWSRMAGVALSNQFKRWAGLLHTRVSGN